MTNAALPPTIGCKIVQRIRTRCAASTTSACRDSGQMPTRRHVLTLAAAAAVIPFAPILCSRAAQRTVLNDASRLNPTPIAKHISIIKPQAIDDVVARVRAELKEAPNEKRPVAASVARHSMGGQSLPRDGTAISLDGGPLEMDTVAKTYRTSAGNRWWDVIRILDPKG